MKKLYKHVIMWTFFALLIHGCLNSPNVSQIVVDENLPTITNIRTLTDMQEIGLEWTPYHDANIQGYYIYRSSSDTQNSKLQRIATIDDRYVSHFVDENLKPNTTYTYRISIVANSGKESKPSQSVSVTTNPQFDSVPFVEAIAGLPKRAKIIWRPHPFKPVSAYIIQRSNPNENKWKNIKTVHGRLSAEFIDTDVKSNQTFKYRIISKTQNGALSKPSKEVIATTKPLPPQVTNVQATNNLPKKISLSWSKVDGNISYYKIYSSPTSMLFFTYLAKTKQTQFDDLINSNDTTRFYKITAVSDGGLESLKQDEPVMGKTLNIPQTPLVQQPVYESGAITLSWQPNDNRAINYKIIKHSNGSEKILQNIKGTTYTDTNVYLDTYYEYEIISIDEFGLSSEPSKTVGIKTPSMQEEF